MNYLSFSFVVFVFIVLVLYYALPKKLSRYVLLLASLLFYVSYDTRIIFYLLFVAASTYLCAKNNRKKALLITCIVANVLLWCFLKANWILRILSPVTTTFFSNILIPVGISYYMLQAISYLVDVWNGKIHCESNFGNYLLFLSYFPAVVQGPISRYSQLATQLSERKPFDFERILTNLTLVLFGLVKKIIIADRIAIVANYCFENYTSLHGIILYVGAVSYAIQLYTDFSGCVDICRGVSGMLGIDLVQNFNRPYFSESIKEFWGRWHLSLSQWLKDYIYIPLGGNRKGKMRKNLNLVITFAVSGLWHGSGTSYIVWGLLQAFFQIVSDATQSIRNKWKRYIGIDIGSFSDKLFRIIVTFNLTTFSWIFFRSRTLTAAIEYIQNMFKHFDPFALLDGSLFVTGIEIGSYLVLAIHVLLIALFEGFCIRKEDIISKVRKQHVLVRWGFYFLIVSDLVFLGAYGGGYNLSGFLYGVF